MLTEEQTKSLKTQLIRYIENSFPEDKKEFAISQVENMDSKELEEFMIRNNLLKKQGISQQDSGQCVFCSIVFGDINSYKIAENSKAIAVLEINPVSRGHTIIIPKEHITSEKDMPEQVSALSKKVSSIIKSRLKPKSVKIVASNIMGHEIFNIIPIYQDQKDYDEKRSISKEELEELQGILKKKSIERGKKSPEKSTKVKKVEKDTDEKIWLPKRIP